MIGPIIIVLLLLPLAITWWLWLIFVLLAALPGRPTFRAPADAPRGDGAGLDGKVDVLIPAHDEELVLPALLESLARQSAPGKRRLGRVLVVADRCADQTAAIARRFGAEVLERSGGPRGKPGALRDGLRLLQEHGDAGSFTLLLDADCTVTEDFLEEMIAAMDAGHAAAQAAYFLDPPHEGQPHSPGTIAFALKNVVRPRGMSRLGIPTQLFGTGMCFRAPLLRPGGALKFSDHLTEDLAASHDLLLQGIAPVFVGAAAVRSRMPADRRAMSTQKLRWETGQARTWMRLPGMMCRVALRGQWKSLLALLDWSAPPLAMGLAAWTAIAAASVILYVTGHAPWWIVCFAAGAFALLAAYVLAGTLQVAGPSGVLRLLIAGPRFFAWKLALYGRMLTGRGARGWEKTARAIPPEVRP